MSCSFAFAQTTGSATILGAVTDPTGAAVVGAKVSVVNTDTSFLSNSATTAEGTYYVPYLNPGPYRLTIQANGFKEYVRDGIVLRMNESPRLDVQLELGSVTEALNVTAAVPLLETETSASGQIMEGSTVVEIPVLEKNFTRMTLYMPGVDPMNGQHILGQRDRAIDLSEDGISGKEPGTERFGAGCTSPSGACTMIQSLDLVEEFKLWTTGLPAEFGHSAGGLLSTVFKSGTNQIHGSLEDRATFPALVNRSYFEILGINYTYHEASGTVGGPVYLPKIYNGKNRTFFFFGVQEHYGEIYESVTSVVPSQAMLTGDFSFGGLGYPIYDPASTRQNASGTWIRDPIPGNQVPQSRFDPVARNLIGMNPWKQPNTVTPLTRVGPLNNLVVERFGGYYFTRYDGKVDHQFSPFHRIFVRYSQFRDRSPSRESAELTSRLFDSSILIPIDMRNVVFSDTYTLNPTTINEFRLGFSRRHSTRLPATYNGNFAQKLGIPNVSPLTFPQFAPSLSNYSQFGGSYFNLNPGSNDYAVSQSYTLQDNFTKVIGHHTFKTGYEMIKSTYDSLIDSSPSGTYVMGGTDNPFTPNTGNDFASLLLGSVVSATFTHPVATWLPRWWSHAAYFQDDYKPMRNLTFNLGLRWTYESPFQTKYGQQSEFNPTVRDPVTGLMGAITHPTGPLASRDLKDFEPRLGLAWNFKSKWVFRSNFGIIHSDLMTNAINQNFDEYLATASVQLPPGNPTPAFYLSQGPPSINYTTAANGTVPFVGTNYSARTASWFDPHMKMPYIMNWSGSLQWQISASWLLELSYQGTAGDRLLNAWDSNTVPLNVSTDPVKLEQIREQYQNFRPYPQFGSVVTYSNFGHSTYHGGTFRLEKRYSNGLTLNSFYTFSKTIDNADDDGMVSGITFYNRSLEKARAGYDVNQRDVTTLTYELPYGHGKKFGNHGGLRNAVLGGWRLMYSQTFQSGLPFTVTFAGSPNVYLPGSGVSRPNQVQPNDQVKLSHVDIGPNRFPTSAENRYLMLAGFQYPASFTPGTLGRNTLSGPGLFWCQASLAKSWLFRERLKAILRFDVNNPPKYQNFGLPNAVYNASNPASFGTFSSVLGSLSDVGTSRRNGIFVFRVEW